jgi:DNA-binding NarL/FixJ family response regulator
VEKLRVAVWASDPIALAGLVKYLEARPEIVVVPGRRRGDAAVLVVACERVGEDVLAVVRGAAESGVPIVLVTNQVDQGDLGVLAECHVVTVLRRATVSGSRLAASITDAASGRGASARELSRQVEGLRLGTTSDFTGLSAREVDVLRLMAQGWDTAEIAGKLCYSERTVKNVIHAMTSRLKLRNRPHVVAYALRAGLI